jgi:hypothetical protein
MDEKKPGQGGRRPTPVFEKKRGFFEAIVTKKQGYRPTTLYKGNINTMHISEVFFLIIPPKK